jgi:hypothetical protein
MLLIKWLGFNEDLRFSQRWLWRVLSPWGGIWSTFIWNKRRREISNDPHWNWRRPIFRDAMRYSPLKFNRYFGRTCNFHLQGRRISQTITQHEAGSKQCEFQLSTWRYIPEDRTFQVLVRIMGNFPQSFISYTTILFSWVIVTVFLVPPLKKTKLHGRSPQANYRPSDRRLSAKLVPAFAGRGCCVISAKNSHGR